MSPTRRRPAEGFHVAAVPGARACCRFVGVDRPAFPAAAPVDRELLDDRIGNRAALVLKPGTGSRLPAGVTGDAAANDTAIVDDDSSGLQEWFDANKPVAVALRPDRYILGTAAEMDEVSDLLGDGTDAPG